MAKFYLVLAMFFLQFSVLDIALSQSKDVLLPEPPAPSFPQPVGGGCYATGCAKELCARGAKDTLGQNGSGLPTNCGVLPNGNPSSLGHACIDLTLADLGPNAVVDPVFGNHPYVIPGQGCGWVKSGPAIPAPTPPQSVSGSGGVVQCQRTGCNGEVCAPKGYQAATACIFSDLHHLIPTFSCVNASDPRESVGKILNILREVSPCKWVVSKLPNVCSKELTKRNQKQEGSAKNRRK